MTLDRRNDIDPEDMDANDPKVKVPEGTRDLRQDDLNFISTLADEVRGGRRTAEGFRGVRCFRKTVSAKQGGTEFDPTSERIVVFGKGSLEWSPADSDFKLLLEGGDNNRGDTRYILREGDRISSVDLDSLARMVPEVKKDDDQQPAGLPDELMAGVRDFVENHARAWDTRRFPEGGRNAKARNIPMTLPSGENADAEDTREIESHWYETYRREIVELRIIAQEWLVTDGKGRKWYVSIRQTPFLAMGPASDDAGVRALLKRSRRLQNPPVDVLYQMGGAFRLKAVKKSGQPAIVYDGRVLRPFQ